MWVIFLVARTVPPNFVDQGPGKWPLPQRRNFFPCSPRRVLVICPFHEKSWFQNQKLPFGRKYQTFGVKVYFFVFRYVGTRNFFRHIESCSIEFYRVVMFILYISWPQSLAILLFKPPFSLFSSNQNKKFCFLPKSLGCLAWKGHFWPQNMLSWAHI